MRRTPRPLAVLGGACLLLLAVNGCGGPSGKDGASAADLMPTAGSPTAAASSATPAATGSPPATPSATPSATPRRATPRPTRAASGGTRTSQNQLPVVRWVRAIPDRVDPLACTPPKPAERPLVIADVRDADDPVTSLAVTLHYGVSGGGYNGDVRMRYDPSRRAFVYQLPPVTKAAVGSSSRSIGLSVTARDRDLRAVTRRPVSAIVLFQSYCLT